MTRSPDEPRQATTRTGDRRRAPRKMAGRRAAGSDPRPGRSQRTRREIPPSYERFLRDQGAGSFRGSEFYGVVDASWDSIVPDAIGLTLDDRANTGLPDGYIIISDTGDGDWYVLDTA